MIRRLIELFTSTTDHFEGQEPGEVVTLLVRQHSFTIMAPMSFLFLFALAPLVVLMAIPTVASVAFFFLSIVYYMALWIVLFYRLTLYTLNTMVVTDRRIVSNEQKGFFQRKVSELNAYRVQDISINVSGMIRTFFDFGDIVVQSAASEREFIFEAIGEPDKVKDTIMKVATDHQSKVGLS